MKGLGLHERDAQARTSRGRAPGLRARLAHDYAAAHGRDPDYRQLDWLERVGRWLIRCPEGPIDRTIGQIVTALGLPSTGTVRGDRQRYRNQIVRTLGYLQAMGWVEARDVLYEDSGEGRCILVRPAGVAQSVRAAES